MKSTVVLVVRHTDVQNPRNILYGRLPRYGLSDLGRKQAERTAEHLADEPIACIYTSPQLRARQTARAIASCHLGVPVRVTKSLAEVLTSFEGTPFADLGPMVNIFEPTKLETDETIARIFARMHRALRRAVREFPEQTTVLVSHADPIMFLRVGLEGKELRLVNMRGHNYPEKGSITRFEYAPDEPKPLITYVDPSRLPIAASAVEGSY
jgi:broad specificity phosphatase PhoE